MEVSALQALLGEDIPITGAQLTVAANTFAMLASPVRLRLVWFLATRAYDVTSLADLTGANVPATSQHLAKLRAAGIVSSRRAGRQQFYYIDDPHILSVVGQMFSHISPDGTLAPDGTESNARGDRRPEFY